MKLTALTIRYIDFKRATGMRFGSEAWVLRAFCRTMGDIDLNVVRLDAVLAYIAGDGPVTSFWHHKFKILNGFYRFAIARGYTQTSPLPTTVPQCPPPHPPYIYTVDELRRLLAATDRLTDKGEEQTQGIAIAQLGIAGQITFVDDILE